MQLLPLRTPLLRAGDDMVPPLREAAEDGDIIVISSKAIATVEGAAMDLASLKPSAEAVAWSERIGRSAAFCEAVLRETSRMRGEVITHCPSVMLTQLRPEGLGEGALIVPNAGLDESNIGEGRCVGWPKDPVASLRKMKASMGKEVALIVSDSCLVPRRKGVLAFALACVGIDPFRSEIGKADLFGKPLKVTVEAVADQLSVMGNAIMGNASQATPAAIIRASGIPMTGFEGWVAGIEPEKDVFRDMFARH